MKDYSIKTWMEVFTIVFVVSGCVSNPDIADSMSNNKELKRDLESCRKIVGADIEMPFISPDGLVIGAILGPLIYAAYSEEINELEEEKKQRIAVCLANLGYEVVAGQIVAKGEYSSTESGADTENYDENYQKGKDAYDRKDYAIAIQEWRPLAQQGDAAAQNVLGALYLKGTGDLRNVVEAQRLFHLAADQGYIKAQSNLGKLYEEGNGVRQDISEAVKWYRLAADQGDSHSEAQLKNLESKLLQRSKTMQSTPKTSVATNLEALKESNACISCFLQEANLVAASLQNAVLYRADLQRADLRNANLRKAKLDGASLIKANLKEANLRQSSLVDANLQNANLQKIDLENADLKLANLNGADLRGGNLRGADLGSTNLQYADLRGADLREANLQYADLKNAYFQGANVRYAILDTDDLERARRGEAIWFVTGEDKTLSKSNRALANTTSIASVQPVKAVDAHPNKQVEPINVRFSPSKNRPNDVAVIISNADYKTIGRGIPNVTPAYADAEGMKRYFMQAKGIREGNIIHLKDATGSQLTGTFGNERNHKGQLFNWVKPNVSNVYVYYAGHGAPAGNEGTAYLVPSDATSETVDLTGYPLATLYKNLGKIQAKSITVILEACFSGTSQSGSLIPRSSGITIVPKIPQIPNNIAVISAGAANQIASWEKDEKHSLFTKYFLMGMSGEGDKAPYGNGDGTVSYKELGKYLEGTMTYYARRYYGRDQKAQIVSGG
jgi:uncharacterized protein YjbI with pentapeptide repeats